MFDIYMLDMHDRHIHAPHAWSTCMIDIYMLDMHDRHIHAPHACSTHTCSTRMIDIYMLDRLSPHIMTPIGDVESSDTSVSDWMDEWISRQHTVQVVPQESQRQSNQHQLVENDPDITDYPIHSYVLFKPPTGRSHKLLPKHKGPYQVRGRRQSVYTHVHNLRPFLFNPALVNP